MLVAVVASLLWTLVPAALSAQQPSIQGAIVESIIEQGFWDESGTLSSEDMSAVIAEHGESFAFAFTDRAYTVDNDPDRSAAALLALSTLEQLQIAGGPSTLLFVTADDATGATNEFAFANVVRSLEDFDRSAPAASFAAAASTIESLGSAVVPLEPQSAQTSFFAGSGLVIVLGVVAVLLGLASLRSSKKKRNRRVHTAAARDTTGDELQAMSDLILDLDPRVTIADDPELKDRFVDASTTYREVLEQAKEAVTGHEIADLRIKIAKARWKLDVVDAELEGTPPPQEPFTRNNSGSAWDSTRGTGGGGPHTGD